MEGKAREVSRGRWGSKGRSGRFGISRDRTTDFLVFRSAGMAGPGRRGGLPSPGRVVEFGRTSSFKLAVCSASSSNAEVSAERRLPESLLKGSAIVTTPPSRTT